MTLVDLYGENNKRGKRPKNKYSYSRAKFIVYNLNEPKFPDMFISHADSMETVLELIGEYKLYGIEAGFKALTRKTN